MYYICCVPFNKKNEFIELIKYYSQNVIMISYNRIDKNYEAMFDFDMSNEIIKFMVNIRVNNQNIDFTMFKLYTEDYVREYQTIYTSDNECPMILYIFAKNNLNDDFNTNRNAIIEIIDIVLLLKEGSEYRIWNQQFKYNFKYKYHKFINYCLNRNHWSISFKDFEDFDIEKELGLEYPNYDTDSEFDDEDNEYEYYNEYEEAGIDNY